MPIASASPIVIQTDPVLASPLSISALILAILATIYALYVGQEVVLPIMLAVVLKLLLQPTMDFLRDRLHLPLGTCCAHPNHLSLCIYRDRNFCNLRSCIDLDR